MRYEYFDALAKAAYYQAIAHRIYADKYASEGNAELAADYQRFADASKANGDLYADLSNKYGEQKQ